MNNRLAGDVEGARPSRRRRPRRWNKRRRTLFLQALGESCNVSAAARAAGMDRSSAYDLKDRDAAFAQGWRSALEQAHGALEWRLLEASLEGSVRTQMTLDPATRTPTQIKLMHSYPLTVALRLFLSHRSEVVAFRDAEAANDNDAAVSERVIARMDEIRAKLLTAEADAIWGDGAAQADDVRGDGTSLDRDAGAVGDEARAGQGADDEPAG
jgi:hypothetical protein